MTDCVCQADGSCQGTPKTNGSPCDDGNDCTANDSCQAGECVGTPVPNDPPTACTPPFLGACATGGTCQGFPGFGAFCVPTDVKECPDSGNKCAPNICNPQTGQCEVFTIPCNLVQCTTGQCDPSTGNCIAGNEGADCNTGEECAPNGHCSAGQCTTGAVVNTPTPTGTPTPPAGLPCVGDCDSNGRVTVNEIITGVNIALGNALLTACPSFDPNNTGKVTVSQIIQAVNAALNGCTVIAATPTPTVAITATPGGVPVSQRAAGTIENTTTVFLAIPDLLSAILGHFSGGGGLLRAPAIQIINQSFDCPGGGGGQLTCDQTLSGFPPSLGPPTYGVTLNSCQVTTSIGTALTINGTLSIVGNQGDVCGLVPNSVTLSIPSLTVQEQGAAGSTLATFTNVNAAVSLSCSADSCQCMFDTVDLQLTGTVAVEAKDSTGTTVSSTQLAFAEGSSIDISVGQFGDQCVPDMYSMEVNGNATVTADSNTFQVTFVSYQLDDDATSGENVVDVNGEINSTCFGGTVDLSTLTSLIIGTGPCPTDGSIEVSTSTTTDLITYSATGGVLIDVDEDGSVDLSFPTCYDPSLFVCTS